MKLMTKELERVFAKYPLYSQDGLGGDALVIAKYFRPGSAGTWLITEASPQGDDWLMFGLVDLGFGPEYGYVSLNELKGYRGWGGLGIERDIHFPPGQYTVRDACRMERIRYDFSFNRKPSVKSRRPRASRNAGPRTIFGLCAGCNRWSEFHPTGTNGALVCASCGVEYPPGLYPKPDASAGRGDAVFRIDGQPVVFEDGRSPVPRPTYMKLTTQERDGDGWKDRNVSRMIVDSDAVAYLEGMPGARRTVKGKVVQTVAPVDGGRRRWFVRYTGDVDSVPSLNRRGRRRGCRTRGQDH